jgi:hypothetical protein
MTVPSGVSMNLSLVPLFHPFASAKSFGIVILYWLLLTMTFTMLVPYTLDKQECFLVSSGFIRWNGNFEINLGFVFRSIEMELFDDVFSQT